jgi:ribosomal protein S18 acetylase RimI-like enzyme
MKQGEGVLLRPAARADAAAVGALAGEVFDGVALDYWIERSYGEIGGLGWRERKAAAVREEVLASPSSVIVAEGGGRIVGFITTRLDPVTLVGHIPNLGVARDFQGLGLGKRLLQAGRDLLVDGGARYLQIETLDANETGQVLYPRFGFREVARRIHYFMEADEWRPLE